MPRMARESPGWHAEEIKAALRRDHGPVTHLSAAWGYSRTAISKVLMRPDYSLRLEERIAETLGVPLHEIWPDRWHPDGTPKQRTIGVVPAGAIPDAQKHRRPPQAAHRQKRDAA